MKKYWFTILPQCFLWTKDEKGLVYNTENHNTIKFTNSGLLMQKVTQLSAMDNLYCIRLNEKEFEDVNLNIWIQNLIDNGCALLIEDNGINQRSLSLPPKLKVQDEVDFYQWEHQQGIGGNIIENLHHIIFNINGSEFGNDFYAKQTLYPTTSSKKLPAKDILQFTMNARTSPFLAKVSLIGNPFVYNDLDWLINSLQKICSISVFCTWEDAQNSLDVLKSLATKVNLHIVAKNKAALKNLPPKAICTLLVTSKQEYEMASQYNEKKELINIIPVYTGSNLKFFEECLYMEEDNMSNLFLSKREIFIHQKLNIQDFGKLTVMADGQIYANVNHEAIGNIKDTPHAIVYREITEGHSWLRIRDNKPCCECIYQWLCPTPSHYEDVIGKQNLCNIVNS